MEKRCSDCGIVKLLTEFYVAKKSSDRRLRQCRICRNKAQREKRVADPERCREYGRKYRAANPGKDAAKNKRYRAANPEKCARYASAYGAVHAAEINAKFRARYWLDTASQKVRKAIYLQQNKPAADKRRKAWAAANPDKVALHMKRTREKHAQKRAAYAKQYRADHIEQTKAATKKYQTENRDVCNALGVKRYAQKKKAMPAWADEAAIAVFYTEARDRTRATGIVWHVDHIVPLQSKYVCGLHVEYNLQLLPAHENQVKSNSLSHLLAA